MTRWHLVSKQLLHSSVTTLSAAPKGLRCLTTQPCHHQSTTLSTKLCREKTGGGGRGVREAATVTARDEGDNKTSREKQSLSRSRKRGKNVRNMKKTDINGRWKAWRKQTQRETVLKFYFGTRLNKNCGKESTNPMLKWGKTEKEDDEEEGINISTVTHSIIQRRRQRSLSLSLVLGSQEATRASAEETRKGTAAQSTSLSLFLRGKYSHASVETKHRWWISK